MSLQATTESLTRPAARRVGDAPVAQNGAYAVIEDAGGRVLLVRSDSGRYYLPGGRIEAGETARQGLIREIGEECACSAAIIAPIRESRQGIMDGAVDLSASHWRARLVSPLDCAPEHKMVWTSPAEALDRLHRACDRAAIRAAAASI